MRIYTKTGDKGTTALFGGVRVSKADAQIEAYGSLDELTSVIGLLISGEKNSIRHDFLVGIQKDLYQIMAVLSGATLDLQPLEAKIQSFEQEIDNIQVRLPKLTRFILPGGTERSAIAHICRTQCRRSERTVVAFYSAIKAGEKLNNYKPIIIQYLNRLSDLFFMLAREYSQGKEVTV